VGDVGVERVVREREVYTTQLVLLVVVGEVVGSVKLREEKRIHTYPFQPRRLLLLYSPIVIAHEYV
jgi:hypothetical protein